MSDPGMGDRYCKDCHWYQRWWGGEIANEMFDGRCLYSPPSLPVVIDEILVDRPLVGKWDRCSQWTAIVEDSSRLFVVPEATEAK